MFSKKQKATIYQRAKGLCEYCKSPANISSQPFAIEHIIPQSKGGTSENDNLALSCQGCNNHKYNKTTGIDSINQKEVALFNPRTESWETHFAWSADLLEIVGKTAIGRVTVNTLKLNRQALKNLRQILSEVGKHPPS